MKKITGTIVHRSKGYHALVRTNGEQHLVDLETKDLHLAELRQTDYVRKYLVNLGLRPTKKHKVLPVRIILNEVADKHYASRREMGITSWKDEEAWWRLHCSNLLGEFLPKSVTASDVEEVLLRAKAKGLSKKSLEHIYIEVLHVLEAAGKQGQETADLTDKVTMPRVTRKKKKRRTLTDAEFAQYVQHPDVLDYSLVANQERKAGGHVQFISREIKVLAILARTVGGARASDLHAMKWEHIDTKNWRTITVTRPKVSHKDDEDKEDHYILPEPVIPFIQQWWTDHGQPITGPVFPAKRRLGKEQAIRRKVARSYADDLRRDLLAAGVDRYELHHDTETSRRTDFHSLRRAYVGALHRAGISIRESMDLTSHVSQQVHRGYDVDTRPPMLTPPAIIPALAPVPAQLPVHAEAKPNDTIQPEQLEIEHDPSSIVECQAQSRQFIPDESTHTGNDGPSNNPESTHTYDATAVDVSLFEAGQRPALAANTKEPGWSDFLARALYASGGPRQQESKRPGHA